MMRSCDGKSLLVQASEIGLPPGTWPPKVHVLGIEYLQERMVTVNGSVQYVSYAAGEDRLDVVNDAE